MPVFLKVIYLCFVLFLVLFLILLYSDFVKKVIKEKDKFLSDDMYYQIIDILAILVLFVMSLFSIWAVYY